MTAHPSPAIQRAKSDKKSGFSSCDATVNSSSGITGEGSYNSSYNIHGEIAALEDYLVKGGRLEDITSINISSPPCKYCRVILGKLGILGKVNAPGEGFGSCQGGAYGWFYKDEKVSKALQGKTGTNEKKSIDWVIGEVKKL